MSLLFTYFTAPSLARDVLQLLRTHTSVNQLHGSTREGSSRGVGSRQETGREHVAAPGVMPGPGLEQLPWSAAWS